MKKLHIGIAVGVALLVVAGIFFIHTYTSSPGFTTQEYAQQFYADKPTCYGIDILLNAEQMAADAPGQNLCIGILR
jgi:hypothetical protein